MTYSAHKDMGGGVSIDLIHEWDYLTYLFGMPSEIYSILDKVSDLESGFSAGCKAGVLVLTGHGSEQELKPLAKSYDTAPEILEAVKKLLKKTGE